MNLMILGFSPLEPIYLLFGFLLRHFYNFFGNYGIAIIALTVVVRFVLVPLNVKSQKSMIKMQAMSGKTAELQRKYGDNKEKYQEELMKLQRENGAGFSGCILPIVQLFLLIPMYRIVSGPLRYVSQVSSENISAMIELAQKKELVEGSRGLTEAMHIGLIELLNTNESFLSECISKGYIAMGQLVNLDFFGVDLTMRPSWKPLEIIADPGTYLPLLVFPVLVFATTILSNQLIKVLKPNYKEEKEAKERDKLNPARGQTQAPQDSTEASMKMMNYFTPFMMLFMSFTVPAAMGLYWVVGGFMGIITQIIVYFMFSKPYELKKKELEEKKANAFKKKKYDTAESLETGKKKKKKK
jgi:YidC/Oxa1 family membrane protein insertase